MAAPYVLFINKRDINVADAFMSNSDSSESENRDFFNLQTSDWNDELQEKTKRDYLELQHTMTIEENARTLCDSVVGPRQSDIFETPSKRTRIDRCETKPYFTCAEAVTKGHSSLWQRTIDTNERENMIFDPAKLRQATLGTETAEGGYIGVPKRCYFRVQAHRKPVTSAAWSAKGYSELLLTSSLDGSVRLWSEPAKCCVYIGWAMAGVRRACFSNCGQKIFRCGFDKKVVLVDPTKDTAVYTANLKDTPSCLRVHPTDDSLVLVGYNGGVGLWDTREEPHRAAVAYDAHCGEVLDILLINDGKEVVFSGDLVARDASHTGLMVWDARSGALLSNQVYQERYTCPSLEIISSKHFAAQTNGNYIAIFNTARPYKMNKKRRFEGHKVAGYKVGCCISPAATLLCSGDAEGLLHFYWADSCALAGVLQLGGHCAATSPVWQHGSRLAVGCFDGSLHLCS